MASGAVTAKGYGRLPAPKSAYSKPSAIVPLASAAREASVRCPVAMIVASG